MGLGERFKSSMCLELIEFRVKGWGVAAQPGVGLLVGSDIFTRKEVYIGLRVLGFRGLGFRGLGV